MTTILGYARVSTEGRPSIHTLPPSRQLTQSGSAASLQPEGRSGRDGQEGAG
jgi:hypothetical protein